MKNFVLFEFFFEKTVIFSRFFLFLVEFFFWSDLSWLLKFCSKIV